MYTINQGGFYGVLCGLINTELINEDIRADIISAIDSEARELLYTVVVADQETAVKVLEFNAQQVEEGKRNLEPACLVNVLVAEDFLIQNSQHKQLPP